MNTNIAMEMENTKPNIRLKDYVRDIDDRAERRYIESPLSFLEIETNGAKTEDENTIVGYAAKFNRDSQDFGGWIERIAPGFFDGLLDDSDTIAAFNHSMNLIFGRNKVNLTLSVDDVGLMYKVSMPDTTVGRDVRMLVKSGIITKSSFAFTVAEESFTKGDPSKGIPHVRTLMKGEKLYDVAPVTMPAYEDTSVAARSLKKLDGNEQIAKALEMQKYKYRRKYLEHLNNQLFNF